MAPQRLAAGARGLARACAAANPPPLFCLRHSSTAPTTVIDSGFWKSLVPKPLRKENRMHLRGKRKEWNPATYFIVMFILIGSMSIQMIALRKQTEQYMRQSAVRIQLLREVVDRIRNGEEVDVEKALGTGDPQREADWEEMLRAVEWDEPMRKAQEQENARRLGAQVQSKSGAKGNAEAVTTPTPEPQPSKAKTASLDSFF